MTSPLFKNAFRGLLLACGALVAVAAVADSRLPSPKTALPKYQTECGACHMAFDPAFLPAASWQQAAATN